MSGRGKGRRGTRERGPRGGPAGWPPMVVACCPSGRSQSLQPAAHVRGCKAMRVLPGARCMPPPRPLVPCGLQAPRSSSAALASPPMRGRKHTGACQGHAARVCGVDMGRGGGQGRSAGRLAMGGSSPPLAAGGFCRRPSAVFQPLQPPGAPNLRAESACCTHMHVLGHTLATP